MDRKDIIEEIQTLYTPENRKSWISRCENSLELCKILLELTLNQNQKVAARSAHYFDNADENNQFCTKKMLQQIITLVNNSKNESVLRPMFRLLTRYQLSEQQMEQLINPCFDHAASPSSAVAVRIHCLQLIYQFGLTYNDLWLELKLILQDTPVDSKPAIKAKSKNLLQLISKKGY